MLKAKKISILLLYFSRIQFNFKKSINTKFLRKLNEIFFIINLIDFYHEGQIDESNEEWKAIIEHK